MFLVIQAVRARGMAVHERFYTTDSGVAALALCRYHWHKLPRFSIHDRITNSATDSILHKKSIARILVAKMGSFGFLHFILLGTLIQKEQYP